MTGADPSEPVTGHGVSVGAAAASLGVTTSTLRSWGTRYGIVPSLRTAGGHRRYSRSDLDLLDHLRAQIQAGMPPAAAAASALARAGSPPDQQASAGPPRGGPGGRVLGMPGADAAARGLARAVSQLDLDAAEDIILGSLRDDGVVPTWEALLRPVLVAAGQYWADTGAGIEIEHVLSEAALGALRRRRGEMPVTDLGRPVLLAAAPHDQHTLTLHVVAAGLAERSCGTRVIGAQVPVDTLAAVVRRTRPSAVFVSCVVAGGGDPEAMVDALPATRPPTVVVVGGAGWPAELPPGLQLASSLQDAVDLLARASRATKPL